MDHIDRGSTINKHLGQWLAIDVSSQVQRSQMPILGWLVKGCLLSQYQLCHPPKLLILIDVWRRFFLHNLISWSHELIRQKAYHACWSRMTRSFRLILWTPHLLPLDPYLFQILISQALDSSLLASPQARWALLSFLPDIFTLLLFMINPFLISIPFPWAIMNFIYFYTPTVTGMYPSNSFMEGSTIDSILPILLVFVTAFRTIVQCGELQTFIPAVLEERTSPMRTLLLSCTFFSFSPVRFFFKPPFLLLVLLFLVAFFLLLTLPLVKENTRSHSGFGFGRFPYLNLAFQDARRFFVDLFHCDLLSRVN
jgi:hypothetical protein